MDHITYFKMSIVILCYLNLKHVKGSALMGSTDPTLVNSVSASLQDKCRYIYDRKSVHCGGMGLQDVPDDIPKYVFYHLYLPFNNIRTLSSTSFSPYPQLTLLDVRDNDIILIDKKAFSPLKRLESLDLSNNNNINLGNDPLTPLTGLKIVTLSSNDLSFLKITCSSEMERIDLSQNKLKKLSPNTLTLLCRSTSLFLHDNPINNVDPNTIAHLKVQYLRVGGDNFSLAIWNNFSEGIANSKIQRLQLNKVDFNNNPSHFHGDQMQNSTNHRPDVGFGKMTNIKELSLTNCHLKTVKPMLFHGMKALRVLSLKNNIISCINPSNSSWNVSIYAIDLSNNLLTELAAYAFYGLKTLTNLDLGDNPYLRVLEIESFSGLVSLQKLNVLGTNLDYLSLHAPLLQSFSFEKKQEKGAKSSVISPGIFRYTKSLKKIDIEKSLDSGDLIDAQEEPLFKGLNYLNTLLLLRNDFFTIIKQHFSHLTSLEILELRLCQIHYILLDAFSSLHSLVSLNLKGNSIQLLPLLHGLYKLTNLSIDFNQFMFIDKDAFENTSKLSTFTLSTNFFTGFNASVFTPIQSSLRLIDISGNPWNCNCEAKWLINLLKGNTIFSYIDTTVCTKSLETLESLRGKKLSLFEPSKVCNNNTTVITYLSISLVLLALLSITLLAYHFRWLLGYNIFLLKLAILGYKEIEDARKHENFDYDFNIMFSKDAEGWVGENFRPFLEERLPDFQRNAFGDNDLLLGMHYLEAVDHLIVNSFKTILLLTRPAVQDNWFLIKCSMAIDQSNDLQVENTVVIFLEDIPDGELPFMVRVYLRDRRPYLHWQEGEGAQEYFWNKLVKHLTVNVMFNPLIPPE